MSQTVLKKFSIIEDEDGTKLVVPSSWISLEQKHLWWPPYKDLQKIKKTAANCVEPSTKDWEKYKLRRFIKSNG